MKAIKRGFLVSKIKKSGCECVCVKDDPVFYWVRYDAEKRIIYYIKNGEVTECEPIDIEFYDSDLGLFKVID